MSSQSSSKAQWWEEPDAADSVRAYAHLCGLLMQLLPSDPTSAVNMSATLRPSKFPQEHYELVATIQPYLHELLDAVCHDEAFMEESMRK